MTYTIFFLSLTCPADIVPTSIINISKLPKISKLLLLLFSLSNLILLSGDVHKNHGPPFVSKNNSLGIYFLNAQSRKATTKYISGVNQFRHMTDILEPDIIAVNETWLIPEIPNSEFADETIYAVCRNDRTDIRGGGVLILVKKYLWSKERKDLESNDPNNNEIVVAEIKPTSTVLSHYCCL